MQSRFEYLDSFIGGIFHQDYSIFGDTLEEIVASYKDDLTAEGVRLLLSDIMAFQAEHEGESNTDFARHFYTTFDWGLVEDAFGTPREFLAKIFALLETPEEQRCRAS